MIVVGDIKLVGVGATLGPERNPVTFKVGINVVVPGQCDDFGAGAS